MSSLPDEPAYLWKYAGELAGRIEFLKACDSDSLTITKGILFLMAFWSGPAAVGFRNLCSVLKDTGLPDDFAFQVIDADGVSDDLHAYLFSCRQVNTGGSGETYWFREGRIFADTNVANGTPERIRQLLTESAGA